MPASSTYSLKTVPRDLTAGVVVFLVALPLCLGVAMASGAPLISGIVAGVIGGILVGIISGSHTSVSGPAAGLTTIVLAQITLLESFQVFLVVVILAGIIQIVLGLFRAGFIAAFVPSSVIKGLLAAIGLILIIKQFPLLFGYVAATESSERMLFHPGAATIGILSVLLMIVWDKIPALKKSIVPSPLLVVVAGVLLAVLLGRFGADWQITEIFLVQVPVAESFSGFFGLLDRPDFSKLWTQEVFAGAIAIALVASLETLLNLEAVDKLDPKKRNSPASRELVAQGVGNVASGFFGGLPVTSVIVRSSVNINAGGQTKVSAVFHGLLLFVCVAFMPTWLNMIPLSCLAAILIMTGYKLASPAIMKEMWAKGRYQFIPFAVTVLAIVGTDLLKGIFIGLGVALLFILYSNLRRPIRRTVENHLGGDVLHIELANQVSFLNRAALSRILDEVPAGGHVLLDAQGTDYIDPDVLDLLREFKRTVGPARGVEVSSIGFRETYEIHDDIQYVDYSTRELQTSLTPKHVLQILKDGHQRFRSGNRLTRDFKRQISATSSGSHPFAVILSCIDARIPTELIFDVGVGDITSVRIAGNVPSRKVLGSIEYGCAVRGAKLVLVMGSSRSGVVSTAIENFKDAESQAVANCQHLHHVLGEIQQSITRETADGFNALTTEEKLPLIRQVSSDNVQRTMSELAQQSSTLNQLVQEGKIAIVGAIYDVDTGDLKFFDQHLS